MTKLTEKRIKDLAYQLCDVKTDNRGRETFCFDSYGLEKYTHAIEAELQPDYTGTCGPLHTLDGEALTPAEVQERLQPVQEPVAWWSGKWDDDEDYMSERIRQAHIREGSTTPKHYPIPLYTTPPDQTAELDLIAAREAADKLNELCREQTAEIERLRHDLMVRETTKDERIATLEAEIDRLRSGLENCRLLAARHRKEDWALLILGFCAEAGVVGSVMR